MAEINEDGMNRRFGYPEYVKISGPNLWYLGPNIECERQGEARPSINSLVTWNDGPYTFVLRERKESNVNDDSLPEAQLVYPKRPWKSTYSIGDAAFCKAGRATPDPQEHELVAAVKELEPQIPLPETIHAWKDDKVCWHISRRVPGESLQSSWLGLTDMQREKIATQIAQHACALAKHTSPNIQGGLGTPARITFLFVPKKMMSPDETKAHFSPIPDSDGPFILSHGDLSAGNIIVKDGRLAAIIDWECLRYEPRFWPATAPMASITYSFYPELYGTERENNAWGSLLSNKLADLGYPVHGVAWQRWAKKKLEERTGSGIK